MRRAKTEQGDRLTVEAIHMSQTEITQDEDCELNSNIHPMLIFFCCLILIHLQTVQQHIGK